MNRTFTRLEALPRVYIIFLLIFFAPLAAYTQDLTSAPSLTMGLSGVNFTKGNLDAALIAEIIAEKQQEIKVHLVKNMLLKKIGVDNGLFYTYIDQAIETIATEKDEKTRVKNLLENSVNLAFVISYTDYYLRTMQKHSPAWEHVKQLAVGYGIDTTLFRKQGISLMDFTNIHFVQKEESNRTTIKQSNTPEQLRRNEFVGVLIDLFAEVIRNNNKLKMMGLFRTSYFQNTRAMNAYLQLDNTPWAKLVNGDTTQAKEVEGGKEYLNLIHLLNNTSGVNIKKIKSLQGSLKTGTASTIDSGTEQSLRKFNRRIDSLYQMLIKRFSEDKNNLTLSAYLENKNNLRLPARVGINLVDSIFKETYSLSYSSLMKHPDPAISRDFSLFFRYADINYKMNLFKNIASKKPVADLIFTDASNNLEHHLAYFGLIKSLALKGDSLATVLKTIQQNFHTGNVDSLYKRIFRKYKQTRKEITQLAQLTPSELNALDRFNAFIEKLHYVKANPYQYLGEYENTIRPSLNLLARFSPEFIALKDSVYTLLHSATQKLPADFKKLNIQLNTSFINIFRRLDEFDNVETYDQYLNLLSDAGDVFSDEHMRNAINKVISFIRMYIKPSITTSNDHSITLDVEGFIYALQKLPYNKFRPVEFLFTVGANNAAFNKQLYTDAEDTVGLANYSFVGEKIGIKWKLLDWKYKHSFSRGETYTYYSAKHIGKGAPTDPTVSNIHVLVYGSGLLYNLLSTGTTKNFNRPLVGVGVGLTFFNGLDTNVSWGKPILKDRSFFSNDTPSYFNIGFDIQFMEYYGRLVKKRNSNQLQKKLAAARR